MSASIPIVHADLHVPESVTYAGYDTRDQIVQIANSVWDDGLFVSFGRLPTVISVSRCPFHSSQRPDSLLALAALSN
jgi:hypothetical protein